MTNEDNPYEKRIRFIEEELVVPRFAMHVPHSYERAMTAPVYDPPIPYEGERYPLPPANMRGSYSPENDDEYIYYGKQHKGIVESLFLDHYQSTNTGSRPGSILDYGCYTGRVLRHFLSDPDWAETSFLGCDIQSDPILWNRKYLSDRARFFTSSFMPHLPLADNSVDAIYGISVFTHTKYLWDMWLMELERVMTPGGIMVQTVQTERAWRYYHENRDVDWVKAGHPQSMLQQPEMTDDFYFWGNTITSQCFYKKEALIDLWSHYFEVVAYVEPNETFQDFIALSKR